MVDVNKLRSVTDLVEAYVGESQAYVDPMIGREDEPAMVGYAEYGIPWYTAACQEQSGLQDIATYRALVENVHFSVDGQHDDRDCVRPNVGRGTQSHDTTDGLGRRNVRTCRGVL